MEHTLGHANCPACQRYNGIRIQEIVDLRAVNAQLLAALEYTTAFLSGIIEGERIPTGIKASARVQITAARNVIKEAKK